MRDRQKKAEGVAKQMTEDPAKQQARWQRDYEARRREFDAAEVDDLLLDVGDVAHKVAGGSL